ncbi:MAG: FmdB family zinc ribbon protein [Desulfovibrio sp.]|jgi:putative FmdB family regulatory protein|nr:zinc ribbon domain-containing protein [Mailhella sp.]
MPIYEYACPACGRTFEELCLGGSGEEKPCPSCGASSRRVISNTSFILKGGGWFASSYGHGTSNLFDKSHGVPSVHDGGKPESGSGADAKEKGAAAPAEKTESPKPSGGKEQQ